MPSTRSAARPSTANSRKTRVGYGENAKSSFWVSTPTPNRHRSTRPDANTCPSRLRRERQVHHCQADEDHTPERIHPGRACHVPPDHIQECHRLRKSPHRRHEPIRNIPGRPFQRGILQISARVHRRPRSREAARCAGGTGHHLRMARFVHIKSPRTLKRVLSDGLCSIVRRRLALPNPPRASADRSSFFDEVMRIADPNYIPIESDVLRARTKTTGIYETRFTMGQLSIQ